jgi:hypothetical protein
MRTIAARWAAAMIVGAAPAASMADVTPIKIDAQQEFKHRPSGIVVPASAAGIARTSVEEFDDKQLDVAAEYRTADDKEITTIYVFRKVTGDVPLWFDRIQHAIESRDMFASPTLVVPPSAFVPPGETNARGLLAVYAAGGSTWKSTGAALTTTGEWYVSVRASSKTLAPQELLARIQQTLAAIKWPRDKVAGPVAVPMTPCRDALRQPGQDAQPVKDDLATALVDAAGVDPDTKDAKPAQATGWCRDPTPLPFAGIYRPKGAEDRYLIAFQDAGRGLWVGPNDLADILAKGLGQQRKSYMVQLVEIDRYVGLGSFASLPSAAQAVWLNEHGSPTYSATTWGKKHDLTINSDLAK